MVRSQLHCSLSACVAIAEGDAYRWNYPPRGCGGVIRKHTNLTLLGGEVEEEFLHAWNFVRHRGQYSSGVPVAVLADLSIIK